MKKSAIPAEIQDVVNQKVETYNRKHKTQYLVSFKGRFCYLSRLDNKKREVNALLQAARMLGFPEGLINKSPEQETKIGRLGWTGDMENWDFSVFRYSNEKYDEEAAFFMAGFVSGSIEDAMEAGYKVYP